MPNCWIVIGYLEVILTLMYNGPCSVRQCSVISFLGMIHRICSLVLVLFLSCCVLRLVSRLKIDSDFCDVH